MTEIKKKKAIDRSQLHTTETQTEQPTEQLLVTQKQPEKAAPRKKVSAEKKAPNTAKPSKKTGKGKNILITIVVVLLLFLTAFKVYVDNDYEALQSLDTYQSMTAFEIERSDNAIAIQNMDVIERKEAVGFIIYGDERVERECYLPLMISLVNQGYCVYLPTTFGNLPFLNQEGAEYVMRTYKSVKTWYIIAHGKACQVAARYTKTNVSKINGLIYLGGASYHTDLSNLELPLLSVTGSLDTVVDTASIQKAKRNDPVGTQYLIIEGGNHTGFADTKQMRGDQTAAISTSEQIDQTVSAITAFIQQP